MRIALPARFDLNAIYPFLADIFDPDDGSLRSTDYDFDFSALGFIKPEGVAALGNVLRYLQHRQCLVRFSECRVDTSTPKDNALRYLDDCHFFEHFLGYQLHSGSSLRPTTIPLKFIGITSYYPWVRNHVIPWLDRQLGISTLKQLPEFPACLDELFNNIIDHAQVTIGSVHMQHFPKDHEVLIAVADFGVGVPSNIRKVPGLEVLSDAQTLAKAIEHGVSSNPTPRNRGAGLDTLVQNVIVHNKGRVAIHSLKGQLNAAPTDSGVGILTQEREQTYPGTLMLITLRTDTIPPPSEDEEAFSWD